MLLPLFSKCKKSTAVVASSTLKLIQPVVPVVNISTTPVSTTCTISDVPSTVSYPPPRIVLDNNIADQRIGSHLRKNFVYNIK